MKNNISFHISNSDSIHIVPTSRWPLLCYLALPLGQSSTPKPALTTVQTFWMRHRSIQKWYCGSLNKRHHNNKQRHNNEHFHNNERENKTNNHIYQLPSMARCLHYCCSIADCNAAVFDTRLGSRSSIPLLVIGPCWPCWCLMIGPGQPDQDWWLVPDADRWKSLVQRQTSIFKVVLIAERAAAVTRLTAGDLTAANWSDFAIYILYNGRNIWSNSFHFHISY